MKILFISIIVLGLLAWSINGISVWVKTGQDMYALGGAE